MSRLTALCAIFERPRQISPVTHMLGKLTQISILAGILAIITTESSIADNDPIVKIDTPRGSIFIRVFQSAAPTTASNFIDLVSRGFYNGKLFHRIENWCIQGGDVYGNGKTVFVDPSTGQPRYIPLEINRNLKQRSPGVVAMARNPNNNNSASCQFYILKCSMPSLEGKYAVFGQVVNGMNAVMGMQRGDQISWAGVIQQGQQAEDQSARSQSGPNRSPRGPTGAVVPYEPPSDIPSSGF